MGIFNHDSTKTKNHTCPMPSPLYENASEPFLSNLSFYQFNKILSGSCVAFACVVIFILMLMHATRLSRPNEQIKIIRICGLIPLYSIFSFLSICFPSAFVYLSPWLDLFQSLALGSFFLLLCEFVSPSDQQRDLFFAALKVPQKNDHAAPVSGLAWYRKKWIAIFQYPVVALVASIATCITQAAHVYCLESSKPYFAHLWISIAQNASVTIAVLAVWSFYHLLKKHLAHHQPLTKLLAFKLIVFLTFIQRIFFWILRSTNALTPTSRLTYADINIGIPTLLICLEMVPFSLFFHYAYSARPYLIRKPAPQTLEMQDPRYYPVSGLTYQGGPLGVWAFLAAVDPRENLQAIAFAFNMATEARKGRV